jgi:hypothetical protein
MTGREDNIQLKKRQNEKGRIAIRPYEIIHYCFKMKQEMQEILF